mgnify:CR=1 FL=1
MNKRASIQLAALKLLAVNGLHATPMSAIAKEAGTGMGTIYNYFPNKEVLINSLYVSVKEAERKVFAPFQEETPIKTQFEEYYQAAVQFYVDNPLYFRFVEQIQASPIITKESKDIGFESIREVLKLVEKGKQDRIIKHLRAEELMQFVGGTILSFMKYHFDREGQEPMSLANQLRMVWDAIKE